MRAHRENKQTTTTHAHFHNNNNNNDNNNEDLGLDFFFFWGSGYFHLHMLDMFSGSTLNSHISLVFAKNNKGYPVVHHHIRQKPVAISFVSAMWVGVFIAKSGYRDMRKKKEVMLCTNKEGGGGANGPFLVFDRQRSLPMPACLFFFSQASVR